MVPPGVLGDERAAHHAAGVAHEVFEHEKLFRCELDQLPFAFHLPRIEVDFEIADFQDGRGNRARAARERFSTREQFLECKRFRDVVVGARTQGLDLRVDGVLCSEHEHRPLESARPQVAQYVEPRTPRQPHVEHDQIIRLTARQALALFAVGDEVHAPALLFKSALYELADGRVVFDDENFHSAAEV